MATHEALVVDGSGTDLLQRVLLGDGLDNSPMLVFIADEDMRYVAVSANACQLLGYSREELLKLRVSDVAVESSAPAEFSELVMRGYRSGTAQLRTKDGNFVTFAYNASETRVSNLHFYLAVGVALAPDPPALVS